MRASVHGTATRPVVAMVGVWDPLVSHHRDVIDRLTVSARGRGRDAAIVIIDPSPGSVGPGAYRYGTGGWPVYDSLATRVEAILGAGVNAVICVRFDPTDFANSAAEFLDVIRACVELDELWLGAVQFLGEGRRGDGVAVATYAERHAIRVVELPLPPVQREDVRYLIAQGRLAEAAAIVGHPPTRCCDAGETIELAWCRGRYVAATIDRGHIRYDDRFEVELVGENSMPGRLARTVCSREVLAFLLGPADNVGQDNRPLVAEVDGPQSDSTDI